MASVSVGNFYVGSVELKEGQVGGEGGPHDPRLVLPLKVTMNPRPAGEMIALIHLNCSLHLVASGASAFDNNQTGPSVSVDLLPGFPCRSLPDGPNESEVALRLPLRPSLVARIESHRHAMGGKDFTAVLRIRGTAAWVTGTGNNVASRPGSTDPSVTADHPFPIGMDRFSFLAPFWNCRIEDISVRIHESHWVDSVLPGLGLDRLRLVEVALPASGGPLPDGMVKHFDAARKDYDSGRYRECVQKCRDVRYDVEGAVRADTGMGVADGVARKVGLDMKGPEHAFLDTCWKALADLTNAANHLKDEFGAPDARACLILTAVVVEYLEGLLRPASH